MPFLTADDPDLRLDQLQNIEGWKKKYKKYRRKAKKVVKSVVAPIRKQVLRPVKKAVKKVTEHKVVRKVAKKVGRYYPMSPIAWKRTAKKYKKELLTAAKIVVPVVGAVLAPFTGGASLAAAGVITAGITVKQQHDAAKLQMQKMRRAERAAALAEIKAGEADMDAQIRQVYVDALETHFLPMGYTDEYWEPLTREQKLWVINEIREGRAQAVEQGQAPVTVPPGAVFAESKKNEEVKKDLEAGAAPTAPEGRPSATGHRPTTAAPAPPPAPRPSAPPMVTQFAPDVETRAVLHPAEEDNTLTYLLLAGIGLLLIRG